MISLLNVINDQAEMPISAGYRVISHRSNACESHMLHAIEKLNVDLLKQIRLFGKKLPHTEEDSTVIANLPMSRILTKPTKYNRGSNNKLHRSRRCHCCSERNKPDENCVDSIAVAMSDQSGVGQKLIEGATSKTTASDDTSSLGTTDKIATSRYSNDPCGSTSVANSSVTQPASVSAEVMSNPISSSSTTNNRGRGRGRGGGRGRSRGQGHVAAGLFNSSNRRQNGYSTSSSSDESLNMLGFTSTEVEALLEQGIKPCDPEAFAALDVLFDYGDSDS